MSSSVERTHSGPTALPNSLSASANTRVVTPGGSGGITNLSIRPVWTSPQHEGLVASPEASQPAMILHLSTRSCQRVHRILPTAPTTRHGTGDHERGTGNGRDSEARVSWPALATFAF